MKPPRWLTQLLLSKKKFKLPSGETFDLLRRPQRGKSSSKDSEAHRPYRCLTIRLQYEPQDGDDESEKKD